MRNYGEQSDVGCSLAGAVPANHPSILYNGIYIRQLGEISGQVGESCALAKLTVLSIVFQYISSTGWCTGNCLLQVAN